MIKNCVAALLLSSAFAAQAPAQTASFIARRDFAAGPGPLSVAVADFNSDGKLDSVVANFADSDAGVSVLLGNGDGTFQPARRFATGNFPSVVVVDDFDGDGVLDLAVANRGFDNISPNVAVLLGIGDGTFQAAVEYSTGSQPQAVAAADFNRDGTPDLAVANAGSADVSVLLGNGDGTFQAAVNYAAGTYPASVAVNDFNGDSVPDLAVANSYSSDVSILPGNGDGTFQTALSVPVGIYPQWVTSGDFNCDGVRDLAVVTQGDDYYFWGHVSVLLGNGDGTFQSAVALAAGVGAVSVSVADVDGDAALDLLVAADAGVLLLHGNGDGTFRLAGNSPTGGRPNSVATGDFDGDGRQDVASANGNSNTLSMLLGNGDGTFLEAATYATDRYPESVAVGDFNRDGNADLAVASENHSVSVLLGNGNATFQPPTTFTAGQLPVFVALGDFNRDGVVDLATADWAGRSVSVLMGNGDGTFGPPASYRVGIQPWSVAVSDFNNDAVQDLAVANHGADPGSNGTVSVLLGRIDGTFSAASTLATGKNSFSVTVGDFNGDLNADLATANIGSGNVSVLLGNGNGTFRAAVNYATAGSRSVVVGDFNADGVPDLAAAGSRGSVLLGNGDGTFQAARTFPAGHISWSVVAGDFNGDGHADLAAADFDSNDVFVLAGNGDGTFQEPLIFGAANGPQSAAASDFNHDGKLDLAVPNVYSNNVSILINSTPDVDFDLSVAREGNGSGTLTSTSTPASARQIDCGTVCAATYNAGTQVILTASADVGSTFTGWTGCDTVSDTTCTVTMSEARSVVAIFTLQRFTLTVTKDGIGRGTVTSRSEPASCTQIDCGSTCSASFDWNTVVTLTATPAFANRFMGWRGCDSASGSTCVVTIHSGTSVTARFVGLPLELSPSANPVGGRNRAEAGSHR